MGGLLLSVHSDDAEWAKLAKETLDRRGGGHRSDD
jgi:hypothetical protein